MKDLISFKLNGNLVGVEVDPWSRLLDVLRGPLGETGTKESCGEGECGACTVMVDGRVVNSCLYPVLEVEGREVVTVEGLAWRSRPGAALQRGFVEGGGIQCGFCTPGIILSAAALLEENPDPTEGEIREALSGNLCRCTGYVQIVESIRRVAAALREGKAQVADE